MRVPSGLVDHCWAEEAAGMRRAPGPSPASCCLAPRTPAPPAPSGQRRGQAHEQRLHDPARTSPRTPTGQHQPIHPALVASSRRRAASGPRVLLVVLSARLPVTAPARSQHPRPVHRARPPAEPHFLFRWPRPTPGHPDRPPRPRQQPARPAQAAAPSVGSHPRPMSSGRRRRPGRPSPANNMPTTRTRGTRWTIAEWAGNRRRVRVRRGAMTRPRCRRARPVGGLVTSSVRRPLRASVGVQTRSRL